MLHKLACKNYGNRYEIRVLLREQEILLLDKNDKEIASIKVCAMTGDDDKPVGDNFILHFLPSENDGANEYGSVNVYVNPRV